MWTLAGVAPAPALVLAFMLVFGAMRGKMLGASRVAHGGVLGAALLLQLVL